MKQRLKHSYEQTIVPALMEQFEYKNRLQVPRVEKIVINRGLGDASQNANLLETGLQELGLIAGQRGVVTRSKRAIAGFKLREKTPVGVSVTLRGDRMYSFLDRLINLALTQRPLVAAGGGERLERASERMVSSVGTGPRRQWTGLPRSRC